MRLTDVADIRYQQPSEIPTIYSYLKLLFAMDSENALYGTTGTPAKFYTHWKNEHPIPEDTIREVIGRRIDENTYKQILADFKPALSVDNYPQKLNRGIKPQDKTILGMLSTDSILGFIKKYVFFDADDEKVARHQQSRAVNKVLDRINEFEESPTGRRRKGGLVWHSSLEKKAQALDALARIVF